jgi:FkbM family methyltransferase
MRIILQAIKVFLCATLGIILARPLYFKSTKLRRLTFDILAYNKNTTLFYVNFGREQFIVDIHDQGIGKDVFASGECEFKKFVPAIELLRKHGVYDECPNLLIDIGANIGIICIPAVARGYVKRAVAIEPSPLHCRLLRANVALNGLTETVSVHERACGSLDGERLELELSDVNFGDNRIRLNKSPGLQGESRRRTIQIKSDTLDTLCPIQRGENSLIWMDTQGYEGHVLAGSRGWLDEMTPLCLEFWPYGMKRATDSFQLLKSAIANYAGFYDLQHPEKFRPIEDLDDLSMQLGDTGRFTDILVIGH